MNLKECEVWLQESEASLVDAERRFNESPDCSFEAELAGQSAQLARADVRQIRKARATIAARERAEARAKWRREMGIEE